MFGDKDPSILFDLNQWQTGESRLSDTLPIGEITSGDLRATLDQMTGNGTGSQQIVIILVPFKLMNQRSQGQRGIDHPAGDDDIRSFTQCFGHRTASEVDIGTQQPLPDFSEGSARLHMVQPVSPLQKLIHPDEAIVTLNPSYRPTGKPQSA